MKKHNRKRVVIRIGVIGIIAFVIWTFRPHPSPSPELVHPDVRNLKVPLKEVKSTFYLDGGTRAIFIRDADNRALFASIPTPTDKSFEGLPPIFLGATHYQHPGAVQVKGYPHTRYALREFLDDHRPRKITLDSSCYALSRRNSEIIRALTRRFITRPKNYEATLQDHDLPEILSSSTLPDEIEAGTDAPIPSLTQ